MEFNIESIASLAGSAYLANARKAFGDDGADGIKKLLDAVRSIYQRCPPESLRGTLTVVIGINSSPLSPLITGIGAIVSIQDYAGVGKTLFGSPQGGHDIVEICTDASFRHVHVAAPVDLDSLRQQAIIYRFERDVDRIIAKTFDNIVPKISPMLKSNFATPTLASLEAAFERYAAEMALDSQCHTLARIWEGGVDGPRLVMVNRPESLMRDSLVHALTLLTRDTSVRPEQNTDETKPVDIRVEWFGSGASALVEVKWIGRSTRVPRNPSPVPTYTDYDRPRAQEGADQLADYMDRQARHSTASAPRGYLVVFDARRRNVNGPQDRLKKEDALHFAGLAVSYSPDHSKTRRDFHPPYRFFMKPRESCFAA